MTAKEPTQAGLLLSSFGLHLSLALNIVNLESSGRKTWSIMKALVERRAKYAAFTTSPRLLMNLRTNPVIPTRTVVHLVPQPPDHAHPPPQPLKPDWPHPGNRRSPIRCLPRLDPLTHTKSNRVNPKAKERLDLFFFSLCFFVFETCLFLV